MIYVITGKPGTGKSTVATDRAIQEYLFNGRRVVTNYHLDVEPIARTRRSKLNDAKIEVLNRFPTSQDLLNLGKGGETEERAGALILDECGMWLNARTWNGKDREQIINWLLKSRHFFWDIYLVVQDYNLLDKQVRDGVAEMVGRCRRFDRIKFFGVKLPRAHMCIVRYGPSDNDVVCERWFYRGSDAHKCFNSYSYQQTAHIDGHYSVVPPRLTKWRYIPHYTPLDRFSQLIKAFIYALLKISCFTTRHDFSKAIQTLEGGKARKRLAS